MGLTKNSMQHAAVSDETITKKDREECRIIALAGNPNVGKSSIFNKITGLNQHTGNWAGKTVTNAKGYYTYENEKCLLVDLPGTYSMIPDSKEEKIARDFICFENYDKTVVVCDATCLERNLNLALQILEIKNDVVICINLIDEAIKNNISIDFKKLSKELGCDVVCVSAKKNTGIEDLKKAIFKKQENINSVNVFYDDEIEKYLSEICCYLSQKINTSLNLRWIALKILENDEIIINKISKHLKYNIRDDEYIKKLIKESKTSSDSFCDMVAEASVKKARETVQSCVKSDSEKNILKNRRIDKWINNKFTGIPLMLLFLFLVFWITISLSNYPSEFLSDLLFSFEDDLYGFFRYLKFSSVFCDILVNGIYRVSAWVVSVMLPPMAMFFPIFTLLEDLGFLPRIAFNLDRIFKKCNSCGKQSLCIAMGFGCNAAGVVGARIIDSKRERLIAILTNSFTPCNGRFPTIILIIGMFFITKSTIFPNAVLSAVVLMLFVLFSLGVTLITSKILSATVLKGYPSSFVLELPPYRIPKVGSVVVRSIFDRTLFVLARAIKSAVPAGLIIWLMSNINANGTTILSVLCSFFEPLGKLMGLDGNILMAFILGFPANEIVLPIAIMSYLGRSELSQITSVSSINEILISNGWNMVTALNFIVFSLFHWPCSTTLMTIKKETGSFLWAVFSFLLPTFTGFLLCMIFNLIFN